MMYAYTLHTSMQGHQPAGRYWVEPATGRARRCRWMLSTTQRERDRRDAPSILFY